jgi:hypothetical protein
MRYLMLMIPHVYQPDIPESEKPGEGFAPPADAVERMMKYNEELAKAGALISLDGLHPIKKGFRVSYKGGNPTVTDGPYVETKEVIGGYWLVDVKSKEDAVEWAKKIPADAGDVVEVRQIFEMEDFPEEVRKAAENPVVEAQIEKHKSKN